MHRKLKSMRTTITELVEEVKEGADKAVVYLDAGKATHDPGESCPIEEVFNVECTEVVRRLPALLSSIHEIFKDENSPAFDQLKHEDLIVLNTLSEATLSKGSPLARALGMVSPHDLYWLGITAGFYLGQQSVHDRRASDLLG